MPITAPTDNRVDFGFNDVLPTEKAERVGEVFSHVAPYYDRMNDIMSFGMHRLWKRLAVLMLDVKTGMRALDIAAGSGDISKRLAANTGTAGSVVAADINLNMLRSGTHTAHRLCCDGEALPFARRSFDRVIIAFGLRNITRRDRCLSEIRRVLKPGGKYAILEFSPTARFGRLYRCYLIKGLPRLGKFAAGDKASYRYLGESILRFPPPAALTAMLNDAGLPNARVLQFAAGAVTLHVGRRLD